MADAQRNKAGGLVDPGYITPTKSVVTVGATSTLLIAANPARRYLLIQNIGSTTVEVNPTGAAAVTGNCIKLLATGSYEMSFAYDNVVTNAIYGIGAGTVILVEGV